MTVSALALPRQPASASCDRSGEKCDRPTTMPEVQLGEANVGGSCRMPRNATGQGLAQRHRGDGLTRTPIRSSKVRSSVITSEATQIRLRLPPVISSSTPTSARRSMA